MRTLAVALLLVGSNARAEPAAPENKTPEDKATERPHERGGLAIGLQGGFASGTASGYPNDLQKIDDPTYYGAGGAMLGQTGTLTVMGAFTRFLSFGAFVQESTLSSTSGRWRSLGYSGGFRVEVFPLVWLSPVLADLGVSGSFGVGGGSLKANQGMYPGADGVQSYLGVGLFYELLFAHPGKTRWAIGPSVEYQLITSRPFERSDFFAGVRFTFYTGR